MKQAFTLCQKDIIDNGDIYSLSKPLLREMQKKKIAYKHTSSIFYSQDYGIYNTATLHHCVRFHFSWNTCPSVGLNQSSAKKGQNNFCKNL